MVATPTSFMLNPHDWVPNNPVLPVLLYRSILPEDDHPAEAFEARFRENGWQGLWRNGIFSYHHYHTQGHEVLGVAGGQATVILGGPGGRTVDIATGDCVVLPAGTGHCLVKASADFLVIGGYPPQQTGDICRRPATSAEMEQIAALPLPDADPLFGRSGPLVTLWQRER